MKVEPFIHAAAVGHGLVAVARRKHVSLMCALALILVAGCKATPPGKFETAIMNKAKHKVLIGGSGAKNPLAPSQENIRAGREAFSHYCVACHGLDGQNTGVPFADSMSPPVPSLASKEVQSYSDGQLKWIIDNGIWPSGMPGSKGILDDDEIWSAVLYIRHLPPAGSLGEPAMYSGDDATPDEGSKSQEGSAQTKGTKGGAGKDHAAGRHQPR
jgi:S-disulfanyl-L-cysteine oxidoreductase SoxD